MINAENITFLMKVITVRTTNQT